MSEFELNLNFYNINIIKESVKDFEDICEIGLDIQENKVKIKINPKKEYSDYNPEEIFGEFCNYVLNSMKNRE